MKKALPLRVILAGYNLDSTIISELKKAAYEDGEVPVIEAITPETISAAYARISRNPSEIPEIRKNARTEVEKARKSNQSIIFGLGHASVAEHAVFNLDILGISRLAVEAVEHHRLASYTEKSQRYIKLDGDYVIPPEVEEAGLKEEFEELIARQNSAYFELFPDLHEYFTEKLRQKGADKPKTMAKGYAGEDARYVVSLATQAQFGMTVNARTLEIMVRRCLAHPLSEVRDFGYKLKNAVDGLAPSLVKYIQTTDYEKSIHHRKVFWRDTNSKNIPEVNLVDYDRSGLEKTLAALEVAASGISLDNALEKIKKLPENEIFTNLQQVFSDNHAWDPAPREFELSNFTFNLNISASCFAQLKRHRMSTIITGPYDPSLGWTIPDSIIDCGGESLFNEVMEQSSAFAHKLAEINPDIAPYGLTNAHRRQVVFSASAREMQHFSRLREDLHAQWDIRRIANEMLKQAREVSPLLLKFAFGKHDFASKSQEFFDLK